ncbi:bifunctional helix-turn-helix transcriptional regulator/GNAT family N-acetyltransferase [Roseibium sp.]|uniref:bifunctional helix-turn-helix transcriptional regulator/GNAT family N-acetyltransferase n=1 Tax=Roseibium sp. TaxID=1936156 RepID=UPI003A96EAF7
MTYTPHLIETIRNASRTFVREHGFLDSTLAGTEFSPSAVHAIIEIGHHDRLTAKDLCERLNLEKSTVSRLVKALEKKGQIETLPNDQDGRSVLLALTDQGQHTLAKATAFGEAMVTGALPHMSGVAPQELARALSSYAEALTAARTGEDPDMADAGRSDPPSEQAGGTEIVEGYQTGMIGDIAAMHARTHGHIVGMGPAFESVVSAAMAEFVTRLDQPVNNTWSVLRNGAVVATISIDGEDLGHNHAHLRWFILSDDLRGYGLGRRLLDEALAHCDRHGFDEIHLWTLKGLDAARALYEKNGFKLSSEYDGDQWGKRVTEQTFVRRRPR